LRTLLIAVVVSISIAGCSRQSGDISYSRQIQPLLDQRCITCHSAESHRGKIVLTSFEKVSGSKAVSGGGPIAIAGHPAESRLYIVSASNQPHFRMPPDSTGFTPLGAADLALIYRWIAQGAKDN
jgi:hypothetical protein